MQSFHFKSPNSEIWQYLLTKFVFNIHTYRSIDLTFRFILSAMNIFCILSNDIISHFKSYIILSRVSSTINSFRLVLIILLSEKKSHQLELSLQIVWFLIGSEPSAVSHSISSCASLLTNLYFSAIKPLECPSISHFPPAKKAPHPGLHLTSRARCLYFFYFRDFYFKCFFFSYSCRAVKASPDRG